MPSIRKQTSPRDKQALLIGALLIVSVGVYFVSRSFLGTGSPSADNSYLTTTDNNRGTSVPLIAPDALLKKIQSNDSLLIVDIRPEVAFENQHIAHSLQVPIGSLQDVTPDKEQTLVIVFSEADVATFETAKNILAKKSFPYFFLQGGLEAWITIGAPTIAVGDPNSFVDQSKVTYITSEALKKLLADKPYPLFILDVQQSDNYQKKHIDGAINIPLDQLEKRSQELPAGRQIIVYGENGVLSFQGGVFLADLGIFSVQTLVGNDNLSSTSGLPLKP